MQHTQVEPNMSTRCLCDDINDPTCDDDDSDDD
jgi:hypothetical protein